MIIEFLILVWSIIMHEMFHFISAIIFGVFKSISLYKFGIKMVIRDSGYIKNLVVLISGIVGGFIPILFVYSYISFYSLVFIVSIMFVLCRMDFEALIKLLLKRLHS